MTLAAKYATRPLDCWQKAKELRINHYRELMSAKEQGKLISTGGIDAFLPLTAGLGEDIVHLAGEPWGASIAVDPALSQACAEAVEAKNIARDLCSYMRNYWGSMFLDTSPFGGKFPRPDFCFQTHFCDTHGKWFQRVAEHFGVPCFVVEFPVGPVAHRESLKLDYLVSQLHEAIAWLQRVTGRGYDDERLIEAVNNELETTCLWAEICNLNKNIPAPLEQKTILSLYIIGVLMRHQTTTVEFYRELKAEVEDRVRDQIAAVPTERCRLLDDAQPPWYFLEVYRYFQKYGAVVIGSAYTLGLMGAWDEGDDTFVPAKPPSRLGITLRNRDEAVRALAEAFINRLTFPNTFYGPIEQGYNVLRLVRGWHADGMVFHLNRGCEGTGMGQMENKRLLVREGIPTMTYEGNMGDKRELNEAQVLDAIDAFMEGMGLKKLEP
jgi:benzoyl-CoA reductase subunit B